MFVFIPPAVKTAGYFRSPLCGWKQKRRPFLDAFAILFEELFRYALSPT
jgi:hypothetical protein